MMLDKKSFHEFVKHMTLFGLLIAVIGSGYILISKLIMGDKYFDGFYNNWQFPMLLAIFIDSSFYKHVSSNNGIFSK